MSVRSKACSGSDDAVAGTVRSHGINCAHVGAASAREGYRQLTANQPRIFDFAPPPHDYRRPAAIILAER